MIFRTPRTRPALALLQFSSLLLALLIGSVSAFAQIPIDTFAITNTGDTARFWAQIPAGYNPQVPPAILIWWHQLGGTQYEMRDYTEFDLEADARGWMAASHFGFSDRHWNTKRAQQHCQAMLDWIRQRYPFSMDSIYMIGGSMGGAAGQVWNNNNCGDHDYLIAATAGGSQILDCQLRQEQYLAVGDTNRSMRADFGGLPSERDSVAFEYHRASAIYFADTSQSMHFNSLNLPVWCTWGSTVQEWKAYGVPAGWWDTLRWYDNADTTYLFPTGFACHGLQCMWPPGVCDWLRNFTVNRYPKTLSINADEDDEYYWTRVELAENDTVFGRYGVVKRPAEHGLDVTIVSNIRRLIIDASVLNLHAFDTLSGVWQSVPVHRNGSPVDIIFTSIPPILSIIGPGGVPVEWQYDSLQQQLTVNLVRYGPYHVFIGEPLRATQEPRHPSQPASFQLVGAYPNPFNAETSLLIESGGGQTELMIYDVLGRQVRSIPLALNPGSNRVQLQSGNLGSGIFFVKLADSDQKPFKIVLLR